jgi:hypothetical protein
MLFSPLRYKAPLAFPQTFSLFFYSYTILSDSLSLFGFGLEGLNVMNVDDINAGLLHFKEQLD